MTADFTNASAPDRQVLWLAGMPRSGTNWGSQILASCPDVRMKFCPLFSYEFKNRLGAKSTDADWQQLFHEVYQTRSEYLDQDYLRRDGWVPEFEERNANPSVLGIKSTRFHGLVPGLVERLPNFRLIALVRHPVAAIHSWLSSSQEFPAGARAENEWRAGDCRKEGPGEYWGFEDWKATTRAYSRLAKAFPDRARVQSYDQLVADPRGETERLFEWAGLSMGSQTSEFLATSTSGSDSHGRSVFKSPSVALRWREEAAPWLVDAIESDLQDDPLGRFLCSPGEVAA